MVKEKHRQHQRLPSWLGTNEHATMDVVMKSIMTVVIIIGLVAIDFI